MTDETAPCSATYPEAGSEGPSAAAAARMVDTVLSELSPGSMLSTRVLAAFDPPEKLLRALLLQALYTVRSERLLMEQLDYKPAVPLVRGHEHRRPDSGMNGFSKNRERLLEGNIHLQFFHKVVEQARAQGLLSDEHFTVDGTLIEAWAGHKSFKPKGTDKPSGAPGTRAPTSVGRSGATTRTLRRRTGLAAVSQVVRDGSRS